eukprot:9735195-Prorocentrum_lima.AAC.1
MNGELQDAIAELFANQEVIVRSKKFYSTTQGKDQLLQDFERSLPHLLVGFMPTIPALPPRRSHAVQ